MRVSARSVAWLLPLTLSACMHKTNVSQVQPLAPPIEDAPPPKLDSAPANLPPPVISEPKPATLPVRPRQDTPKSPTKHARKTAKPPAAGNTTAPAQTTNQVASNTEPEVPAIGRLSSGEPDEEKRQAADSINEIEKGLSGITRKLTDPEEKISTQIKEYLKQARAALSSGDIDGAKTLAVKAKVLLGELTQ